MASVLAPAAAAVESLAAYLNGLIAARFPGSSCQPRWPEPEADLVARMPAGAAGNVVQLGITRIGAPRMSERLGPPVRTRVTRGTPPAATLRHDYGEVIQDIALQCWAPTQRARDALDEIVAGWLSQPFWATISPLVTTTLAVAIPKAGTVDITPASMADIWTRTKLKIGAGAGAEYVEVASFGTDTFRATVTKTHIVGEAVAEQAPVPASRVPFAANVLNLRVPLHHNVIAQFVFEEPSTTDADRGQNQEWSSIRNGTASLVYVREVSGFTQEQLTVNVNGRARRVF